MEPRTLTSIRQEIALTRKLKAQEHLEWAKQVLASFDGPGGPGRYKAEPGKAKQIRKLYMRAYGTVYAQTKNGKAISRRQTQRRKANASRLARSKTAPGIAEFLRRMLTEDQDCFYCKRSLELWERQSEHYIPLSAGGKHEVGNLRVACGPWNISKGAMMPEDFLRSIVR